MYDQSRRGFIDYLNDLWNDFLKDGELTGLALNLAQNCEIGEVRSNCVLLYVDEKLLDDRLQKIIKDSFQKFRNENVFLQFNEWISDKEEREFLKRRKEDNAKLADEDAMDKEAQEVKPKKGTFTMLKGEEALLAGAKSIIESLAYALERKKD